VKISLVFKGSYPAIEEPSPSCLGIPGFEKRICVLAHFVEKFNPYIKIFCITWMPVECDGIPANHQISNVIFV
jgi:uncharacterized membrane protein YfbV (UPF0208 family)